MSQKSLGSVLGMVSWLAERRGDLDVFRLQQCLYRRDAETTLRNFADVTKEIHTIRQRMNDVAREAIAGTDDPDVIRMIRETYGPL